MWSPLPSAASHLSNGMAYPLEFFHLEIQGGIFHLCCFLTVIFWGGECITGAGDCGPWGIFIVVLNLWSARGSFCISTIQVTLCLASELNATPCLDGVSLVQTIFPEGGLRRERKMIHSFWDRVFLCSPSWEPWNSSCRPGWPRSDIHLPLPPKSKAARTDSCPYWTFI